MKPNKKQNKQKSPQMPIFSKSEHFKLFNVTVQTATGKGKHPKHQGP